MIATFDLSLLNLVAHEMRAPLAVVRGYLSLLRDGSLDDAMREDALRAMEMKAEELDGLAEVLVTAARLESADLPHQPTVFDVADTVGSAVERMGPRVQLEGAEVMVVPARDPILVRADRDHVIRVLANLLGNALTYSCPPAEVAIEVRPTSPVEVAVHDADVGLAQECQQRIFERFSRFAGDGTGRRAGLGLGLSISRDLAELNGGELLLERSAPGEGSVFVLRLPRA
jgi:signal transduction histidine kinase